MPRKFLNAIDSAALPQMDGTQPALSTANLLTSGDYEAGSLASSVLPYNGATLSRDTTVSHSGTASLKVQTNSVAPRGMTHATEPGTTVPAGIPISISFWILGPVGVTFAYGQRIYDVAGGYLTEGAMTTVFTGSWQVITLQTFTYPNVATRPGFQAFIPATGAYTFWVDDAVVSVLPQVVIKPRRGTRATWVAANPTLGHGEEGLETDSLRRKVGDGVTAWNSLPYTDLNGSSLLPTGAISETVSRKQVNSVAIATTNGQLRGSLVELAAGQVVTSLSFLSGTTAVATPTHQWFALVSTAGVVLAVTSDDTTTAWAASTRKTLTLTAPYTIPTTGGYYLCRVVTATTMPTAAGFVSVTQATGITPILSVTATGLTTPSTIGTTLTLTTNANFDYGYAS